MWLGWDNSSIKLELLQDTKYWIEPLGNLTVSLGKFLLEYDKKYQSYLHVLQFLSKQTVTAVELLHYLEMSVPNELQEAKEFTYSLIENGVVLSYLEGKNAMHFHQASSYGYFEEPDRQNVSDLQVKLFPIMSADFQDSTKLDDEFIFLFEKHNKSQVLYELLNNRRSVRKFTAQAIHKNQLEFILWSACSELKLSSHSDYVSRTIPSAGGIYPISVYVFCLKVNGVESGIYRYNAQEHSLIHLNLSLPDKIEDYFITQHVDYHSSNVLIFLSAFPHLSLAKYGDRGYRYLLLEAGHIGQNICLAAVACGLSTTVLGGFEDDRLRNLLHLPLKGEWIVYSTVIGEHIVNG